MADLQLRTVGLSEFTQEYFRRSLNPDIEERERATLATKFALCGTDGAAQMNIDALTDELHEGIEATQIRDFDSLLGFMDAPPSVWTDMFVYPVNNPAYTLTSSVHLKHKYTVNGQVRHPNTSHCLTSADMPPHAIFSSSFHCSPSWSAFSYPAPPLSLPATRPLLRERQMAYAAH